MPDSWYYTRNGQRAGPVSGTMLQQMASTGQIAPTDMVWAEGMPQWSPASTMPNLFGTPPPPLPGGAVPLSYHTPAPSDPLNSEGVRWLIPVGRSALAIIAGYLGLFSFLVCPAPISLVVSILALVDLKRHPEKHGMGRAVFGLVMGILGTIVFVIGAIAIATGR